MTGRERKAILFAITNIRPSYVVFRTKTDTNVTLMSEKLSEREEQDILNAIVEFIQAAVHSVLYYRSIYPRESFERCRLYGIVVFRNRHPDVVRYVEESVQHILGPLREKRLVEFQIPVLYLHNDERIVEQRVRERFRIMFLDPRGGDGGDMTRDDWYRVFDDCKATLMRLQALSSSDMMPEAVVGQSSFRLNLIVRGREGMEELMCVDGVSTEDGSITLPLRTVQLPMCSMVCMIDITS